MEPGLTVSNKKGFSQSILSLDLFWFHWFIRPGPGTRTRPPELQLDLEE